MLRYRVPITAFESKLALAVVDVSRADGLTRAAVLFVLNVIKCISYSPLDNTPLIYRLFRDSSVYFVMSVLSFSCSDILTYPSNVVSSVSALALFDPASSEPRSPSLYSVREYRASSLADASNSRRCVSLTFAVSEHDSPTVLHTA